MEIPARSNVRICASLIVRNESLSLPRLLPTLRPWLDAYAIVDTGSTDGTQDVARKMLDGIPGMIVDREWTDFATARNQALDLAREVMGTPPDGVIDYALTTDADHELRTRVKPPMHDLNADCVYAQCTFDGVMHYWREFLVRLDSPCKWYRPIHENIVGDRTHARICEGMTIFAHNDGCRRRDPKWAEREIEMLDRIVTEHPEDHSARFRLIGWYLRVAPDKASPHIDGLRTCGVPEIEDAVGLWVDTINSGIAQDLIPKNVSA